MTIVNIRPGAQLRVASRGVTLDELETLMSDPANLAAAINAAPDKPEIPDDARLVYTDSEDSFRLKRIDFEWLRSHAYDIFGAVIGTSPSKAILENEDDFALSDAVTGDRRKITWGQLRGNVTTWLGAIIDAASSKTALADADKFVIADSAAANATKEITWAQMKTAIGLGDMTDYVDEVAGRDA